MRSPHIPKTWRNFRPGRALTSPPRLPRRVRLTARRAAKNLVISTALKARPRTGPSGDRILAYHLVLPEDRKRFEEHLKFLSDHFKLCTVTELLALRNLSVESGQYQGGDKLRRRIPNTHGGLPGDL